MAADLPELLFDLARGGLDAAAVGALVALCATVVACLALLLPRATAFAPDVRDVARLAGGSDLATTHVNVAIMLQNVHQRNEVALERMIWIFSGATAMLVLQVALWCCALVVA